MATTHLLQVLFLGQAKHEVQSGVVGHVVEVGLQHVVRDVSAGEEALVDDVLRTGRWGAGDEAAQWGALRTSAGARLTRRGSRVPGGGREMGALQLPTGAFRPPLRLIAGER